MRRNVKARWEAIKTYTRDHRDFAFFTAGATSVVLAEMMLLKRANVNKMVLKDADVVIVDEL